MGCTFNGHARLGGNQWRSNLMPSCQKQTTYLRVVSSKTKGRKQKALGHGFISNLLSIFELYVFTFGVWESHFWTRDSQTWWGPHDCINGTGPVTWWWLTLDNHYKVRKTLRAFLTFVWFVFNLFENRVYLKSISLFKFFLWYVCTNCLTFLFNWIYKFSYKRIRMWILLYLCGNQSKQKVKEEKKKKRRKISSDSIRKDLITMVAYYMFISQL